uniref:Tetratricopeptide domain protein n=1 Tax=Solibacter usitatus (strain Ellin6076) TaxID=234267 RepID=Q024R1_SOLUE
MHDLSSHLNEKQLREKVSNGSEKVDDYLELASLLFETHRFEEAIETLRLGLSIGFGSVSRATLLIALGWYLNAVSGDRDAPQALGEEAIALVEGLDACEGLITKARAKGLVAVCAWVDNPGRAEGIATSALALFDRALGLNCLKEGADQFEAFLESARLSCLLSRFEDAATYCKHALQAAPDEDRELSALIELGTVYRESGRLTEARVVLARAIGLQGVAPFGLIRPYFELGLTERALGKTAEARSKVRKAIDLLELTPGFQVTLLAEYLREEGYISYDLDDIEQAARSFQTALGHYPVSDPFHWSSLLWLARCQADLGQFETARMNATLVGGSVVASGQDREDANELLRDLSDK